MATFNAVENPSPVTISNFYGINEAVGETQIKLGEAVSMKNFRITKNFKAQKRNGYETFIDYNNTEPVYMWHGFLDGDEVIISSNNGNVYEYDFATETNSSIGTLSTTDYVNFFEFNGILYIQNGVDYKQYDGITYGDVDPYIPTVYIETTPDGDGTFYEPQNVLTGEKKQEFCGDSTSTTFQLAETNLDSIDEVDIDGTIKTGGGTDYTVDLTAGTIEFSTAPGTDALVEVWWTKSSTASPDDIKKCRGAIDYGVGNDINIFMWGNPDKPNFRFESGLQKPNYFPSTGYTEIGTSQFAITDIVKQYSRQIIFKENATFYSRPEQISYADGKFEWEYPVFDLNEKVGNTPFGQVRLLQNTPASFFGQSVWEWTSTEVEDERNSNIISDKIKLSLLDVDFENLTTFDYKRLNELWICYGDEVYIYNYFNQIFYKFTNIPAVQFVNVNSQVYFTTNGTIERFGNELKNDNGTAITARIELGFTDFGVAQLVKNSRKMWVSIRPESRTSMNIYWQTDRKSLDTDDPIYIYFKLSTFNDVNFGDFSFKTNRNPQPYREKIRIKKYAYVKFIFENKEVDETLTILNIRIEAQTAGEVK